MPYTKGPGGALKWVNPGQGPKIQGDVRTHPISGHQTSQSQYVDTINQAVPVEQGNTGLPTQNQYSGNISALDTSNIDFGDDNQVMQFQGALKNMGYDIDVDGIWGPQTEGFYQDAINKRREGQGLLGYEYDKANAPIPDGQGAPDSQGYDLSGKITEVGGNIKDIITDTWEDVGDWWDKQKNYWDNK